MSPADEIAVSHVTLRVADLARAEAFYASLGFVRLYASEPDASFLPLLDIDPRATLAMVAMQGPGLAIELLAVSGAAGAPQAAGVPAAGLRHIALRTTDIDAAAERIAAAGGAVRPATRVRNAAGEFMMASDPDGSRLLLMRPAPSPEPASEEG